MSNEFVILGNERRKSLALRLMIQRNQTWQEFMMQWGGVLEHDLIAFTAPRAGKTKDTGADANRRESGRVNWIAQKKAGENRVKHDIEGLFPDLSLIHVVKKPTEGLIRWARYAEKYIKERNLSALTKMLNDAGIEVPLILLQASAGAHKGARDERGRVKRKVHYPVLDSKPTAALIRTMIKDVGKAKAGWLSDRVPTKGIPAWVKRHKGPDGAQVDLKGPNYRIVLRNTAPTTNGMKPDEMVTPAMQILERKMAKSLQAIAAHNAKKFNASR